MKQHIIKILLLITIPTFGQNSHCFCEKDSDINYAGLSCDTTILSNNTKLYWQYNCDSIWLTLENASGVKSIINEVPIELYEYTFRLGFYLIKEFDKTVLFQSGCPANGPCLYTLIDKNTGTEIKIFDQLICIDEVDNNYKYDFIVYLSDTTDHLIIYYVNSGRTLKVPFKEKLSEIVPEYQFEEMSLKDNILTLTYMLDYNGKTKTLQINLNDKKYSR